MLELIIAAIGGALIGGGCVYLRYNRIVSDNLRNLEKLKLESARLKGSIEVLSDIFGIDDTPEIESSRWPEPNVNRFNKPSYADDNHNSSGLLDEE